MDQVDEENLQSAPFLQLIQAVEFTVNARIRADNAAVSLIELPRTIRQFWCRTWMLLTLIYFDQPSCSFVYWKLASWFLTFKSSNNSNQSN